MGRSAHVFTSTHTARVGLAPTEVWTAIGDVAAFRSWWPWLEEFDGTTLRVGETWRCAVRPPLPYRVAFQVHLEEIVVERAIVAAVYGDVCGSARVDIVPLGSGSEIRLTAALSPASSSLRFVLRWMAPVARFGHDWVISSGLREFAVTAERHR